MLIKRIHEVAASHISSHVRVLTLRLVRSYSISGYFEKLGVKQYLVGHVASNSKPGLSKRGLSIFRPKNNIFKKVDHAAELVSALQALFKATRSVKSIRLVQPNGFDPLNDIVYATVYARTLVRLFAALQPVTFPESVGLELLDCPCAHLLEAGLPLEERSVSTAASKFSHLTLKPCSLEYAVIKPGTTRLPNNPYSGPRPSAVHGFGQDLLKALCRNPSHFESLRIVFQMRDITILRPCIEGKRDWSSLRHLEIQYFTADIDTFAEFTTGVIAQLKSMILREGMLYSKTSNGWRYILETWLAVKESQPTQWASKNIVLRMLLDEDQLSYASEAEWQSVIHKLILRLKA